MGFGNFGEVTRDASLFSKLLRLLARFADAGLDGYASERRSGGEGITFNWGAGEVSATMRALSTRRRAEDAGRRRLDVTKDALCPHVDTCGGVLFEIEDPVHRGCWTSARVRQEDCLATSLVEDGSLPSRATDSAPEGTR